MTLPAPNTAPLFIFEMANNHMGSREHGLRIIAEIAAVTSEFPEFRFGFKFQYRDLDTFIRPDFRDRNDLKYIRRFSETRLTEADFEALLDAVKKNGFLGVCTPFDEPSVAKVVSHGYDVIKIASCSFSDWPLLEEVVKYEKPIIASTAAATVEQIDRVVSFFQHRARSFSLLHCVAEYPTPDEALQVNQIDVIRHRYPDVPVGFSTHEDPNTTLSVQLALAKGARIFEKHVGVPTESWPLNDYSATPAQVRSWLHAARKALAMCGVTTDRHTPNAGEVASLGALRRGVFAKRAVEAGETITVDDTFFAFPPEKDQFTANDCSKYVRFEAMKAIAAGSPVTSDNAKATDTRQLVYQIAQDVKVLLAKSHVTVPLSAELEISHHYGLERFREFGLTMLTVVNRTYCKKLLVLLPGQAHPEQYHEVKEETFHVLYGTAKIRLDGEWRAVEPGDVVTVPAGIRHYFESAEGAVFEELSSTHLSNDSFYTDPLIMKNQARKTYLKFWFK